MSCLKKGARVTGKMACLLHEHSECGFFMMKLDILSTNFVMIWRNFVAYNFKMLLLMNHKIILKNVYHRTYIRAEIRMREAASALKSDIDGPNMKRRVGVRTGQSLMKTTQLEMLEENDCFLPSHEMQLNLDMLLKMNIG